MKIETHLEKIEHLEASLNKLDDESDYEAIIEIIMLLHKIVAHFQIGACGKRK